MISEDRLNAYIDQIDGVLYFQVCGCSCIRTCVRVLMYAHAHTHMRVDLRVCMHACVCECTHIRTHTHTRTRMPTRIQDDMDVLRTWDERITGVCLQVWLGVSCVYYVVFVCSCVCVVRSLAGL